MCERIEHLLETLRVCLGVAYLWPERFSVEQRVGWARLLVRLQERHEHYAESGRETVDVLRSFHGKPLGGSVGAAVLDNDCIV